MTHTFHLPLTFKNKRSTASVSGTHTPPSPIQFLSPHRFRLEPSSRLHHSGPFTGVLPSPTWWQPLQSAASPCNSMNPAWTVHKSVVENWVASDINLKQRLLKQLLVADLENRDRQQPSDDWRHCRTCYAHWGQFVAGRRRRRQGRRKS